jgi:26S proteasome regulatory subunit N10
MARITWACTADAFFVVASLIVHPSNLVLGLPTMPLEATMIVLDNSEYMRNGDYQPTRFGALADAVTTLFQTKIDSNPENTVGVMTMANKGCVRAPTARFNIPSPPYKDVPVLTYAHIHNTMHVLLHARTHSSPEVLVTHTKEVGQIIAAVHKTSTNLGRTASIPTAIAIAQLALKHRQNKNLRQRVVVFVGSPLEDASTDAERALVRLAKKLKKNNVALDVIAFGDGIEEAGEDGHSILRAFVEAASSSDNSCVFLPLTFLTHTHTHTLSLSLSLSLSYLQTLPRRPTWHAPLLRRSQLPDPSRRPRHPR